jgi:hypothetical protein
MVHDERFVMSQRLDVNINDACATVLRNVKERHGWSTTEAVRRAIGALAAAETQAANFNTPATELSFSDWYLHESARLQAIRHSVVMFPKIFRNAVLDRISSYEYVLENLEKSASLHTRRTNTELIDQLISEVSRMRVEL